MSSKSGVGFSSAVIIILLTILLAFLIPAMYVALEDDESLSYEQTVGNEITVKDSVKSIITNAENNTVNVTVYNSDTGSSAAINNLSEGASEVVSIDGENIEVAYNEKVSSKYIMNYQIPPFFGWDEGTKTIIGYTPAIIIVISFFLIGGFAVLSWKISKEDN